MNNLFRVIAVLVGLCVGIYIGATLSQHKDPTPYQVTDKDEFGGRCYVQTWIEVTPEEYIGLEIGDEFETK